MGIASKFRRAGDLEPLRSPGPADRVADTDRQTGYYEKRPGPEHREFLTRYLRQRQNVEEVTKPLKPPSPPARRDTKV